MSIKKTEIRGKGAKPKYQIQLTRTEIRVAPEPGKLGNYGPFPTKAARVAIGILTPTEEYTQHRQQDRGRAISLDRDPKYKFRKRLSVDEWEFSKYIGGQIKDEIKFYVVKWDGIGYPKKNMTLNSSFSQGFIYQPNAGPAVFIPGNPDAFTWAVWFLNNAPIADTNWPPIPSRNSTWVLAPAWPEYPYP